LAKEENTNWRQSVGGIVMKENKVLLVRHTYGSGKGKLIIPGGYVQHNETPQDAARREVLEETSITAEPTKIVGIRFNLKDWYVVFLMDYVEGTPCSDNDENSEAIFVDINEAILLPDVAELTKKLLQGVIHNKDNALEHIPYEGNSKNGPYSLYGI
jgi:ADP-ribose pyrophosphatase YjhB (NUDIX family)